MLANLFVISLGMFLLLKILQQYIMMKSLQPEDFHKSLYEAFLIPRKEIEQQINRQNKYITIILGCLVIGAVILLCMLIL